MRVGRSVAKALQRPGVASSSKVGGSCASTQTVRVVRGCVIASGGQVEPESGGEALPGDGCGRGSTTAAGMGQK